MRIKTLCSAFLLCLSVLSGISRADVDYHITDDADSQNGWVQITLDDSHDLLMISRDGDELVIQGLMFDQNEFPEPPSLFSYSEDELFAMAAEDFHYDNSFDDIQRVIILCHGGHDAVLAQTDVPVEIIVFGGEGDDYLEGSMMGDNLQGGPGRDRLKGRGGPDVLHGGNDDEKDRLEGNGGEDVFVQYYEMQSVALATLSPAISFNTRYLRPISSRYQIQSTQTQRVDQETLVDYDENEDLLFETEI